MLGDVWGTTEAETRGRFPCDDYVEDPSLVVWRSVSIEAPVHDVWPWLVQLNWPPTPTTGSTTVVVGRHTYATTCPTRIRATTSWPLEAVRSGSSSRSNTTST